MAQYSFSLAYSKLVSFYRKRVILMLKKDWFTKGNIMRELDMPQSLVEELLDGIQQKPPKGYFLGKSLNTWAMNRRQLRNELVSYSLERRD